MIGWVRWLVGLVGGLKRQATWSDLVCSRKFLKNRIFPSQNSAVKIPVWPQYVRQISKGRDRGTKMRPGD